MTELPRKHLGNLWPSRKTNVNLWYAAFYGALFSISIRMLHSAVSSDTFFPNDANVSQSVAEFIGSLLPGIGLFVGIGYVNNRKLETVHQSPTILSTVEPKPRPPSIAARSFASKARTLAIWIFGILAGAIIGGLIASRLEPSYGDDGSTTMLGIFAGVFTFACLRLWLASPRKA